MNLSLNREQLNHLFPFYVQIDSEMNVVSYGDSLAKILSVSSVKKLKDLFHLKQPEIKFYDFESLKTQAGASVTFQAKEYPYTTLRGEIVAESQDNLFFLGTPNLSSVDELNMHQLTKGDFAIHDHMVDLLGQLKAQQLAGNESKALFETVSRQRNELRLLSMIARETVNAVIITDIEGNVEWVNRGFETMTGYQFEEVRGRNPGALLQGKETQPEAIRYMRDQIVRKEPFVVEVINYNSQDKPYWVRINAQPLFYDDQEIIGFFAIEENITQLKEIETALVKQRRFYETILNNIPSDVVVFDKEGRYMFANPVAIADPEVRRWIIGNKDEDYCKLKNKPQSIAQARSAKFNMALKSKQLVNWEEELTKRDGSKDYIFRNMYPVLDDSGEVDIVIGYGINITERKLIEQQSEMNERRYRNLIQNSLAIISTHDLKGNLTMVNPQVCKTFGYSEEEMLGKSLKAFIPVTDRPLFEDVYLRNIIANKEASGVFRVVNKNGQIIYNLYNNFLMEEAGQEPYVINFSVDITARIKAERELEMAKLNAEHNAEAKQQFLANMSHEIRTPMNGIIGISELLKKSITTPQQHEYLHLIQESAKNLLVIVNDVLDIEKIIAGKLELENIPFRPCERVHLSVESFRFKAEEKQISLSYKNNLPEGLLLKGDPYRLSQILNNLINNAIKFTEKGNVHVRTRVKDQNDTHVTVEFIVTDTGTGIAADKLEEIFEPYVQAGSDISRKYGGTGLGLAICKNLIQMHGGEISVRSESGHGSKFSFSIPFARAVEEVVVEHPKIPDPTNIQAYRILVAEDVEINQFLIKHILQSWGCNFTIVPDGLEAFDEVFNNDYDLVLMDIQMPVMNGVEATKRIRQLTDPVKASVPIIALTANALRGDNEQFIAAGMNGYIPKPFAAAQLLEIMEGVIATTNRSREVAAKDHKALPWAGYELAKLHEMAHGDETFVANMAKLFINTIPPILSELKSGLNDKDWKAVSTAAHKLKSPFDALEIPNLYESICEVETAAKTGTSLEILPDRISELMRLSYNCIENLKRQFSLS